MKSFIQDWIKQNEKKILVSGSILEPLTSPNDIKFSFGFSNKRLACSYEILMEGTLDFVIFDTNTFDSLYTETKNFINYSELGILLDKYFDFFILSKDKSHM